MNDNIRKKILFIPLLIIDMLRLEKSHPSHFTLQEVLNEIRIIKPKKVYLIGMNHTVDHDSTNEMLKNYLNEENLDIECAYDGLCLQVSIPKEEK